jgi:ATP-dependent DNA ligase
MVDAVKTPRVAANVIGTRPPRVGALYVGRREGRQIVYAGKIRVGLPLKAAAEMRSLLPPAVKRKVTLLRPEIEAEVAYSNVTADGVLRHGMLKGLRYDLQSAGPGLRAVGEP